MDYGDLNPRFDALRNAIYHSSRRRFFELLTRSLSFLVVVSGTVAVSGLLNPKWLAAAAAVIGASQLVFDFSGRARVHEMLQRKYYDLIAQMDGVQNPTDSQIGEWQAALNRIYVDEPPPMRALDAIAYNAACRHVGGGQFRIIKFWHVFLSQIYPFPNTNFVPNAPKSA